jgi:putative endonuclease
LVMDTWTVYILICSDEKIYTGCTNNFDDRLVRHNKGQVLYTQSRLPVTVVLTINFYDKYQAYKF